MSLSQSIELLIPKARELSAGLSSDAFVWRPAPDAWSVAECLDHLNTTNRLYIDGIRQAIAEGRSAGAIGSGPFRMGWLESRFVASLEPPVKLRFKAPAVFRPAPTVSREEILAEWEQTHRTAAELARSADGLHLSKLRVQSPATRLLKFSLFAAFQIIPAHDRRHLWQAARVIEQMPSSLSARV